MLNQVMEQLIRNSGIGALAINQEQSVIFWSEEAQHLTNFAADEVVGRRCWEIFAGRDEEGRRLCRPGCKMLLCAEFYGRVPPFITRVHFKDGREGWVNVVSLVVPSPRGERVTLFHILQDIDRLKQAEQFSRQVLEAVTMFKTPPELRPLTAQTGTAPREIPFPTQSQVRPHEDSPLTGLEVQTGRTTSRPCAALKDLTVRETEVLRLLSQGANTMTIAEKLVISHATARNHVQHILAKMGAHNRLEAALAAFSHFNA